MYHELAGCSQCILRVLGLFLWSFLQGNFFKKDAKKTSEHLYFTVPVSFLSSRNIWKKDIFILAINMPVYFAYLLFLLIRYQFRFITGCGRARPTNGSDCGSLRSHNLTLFVRCFLFYISCFCRYLTHSVHSCMTSVLCVKYIASSFYTIYYTLGILQNDKEMM